MGKRKNIRKTAAYVRRVNWAASYLPYEAVLNSHLIGQPDGCRALASLMAAQVNRAQLKSPPISPRILIVGPPSSGKTFAVENIARILNLPNVTLNMGLLSPEGYNGANLTDALRALLNSAGIGGAERIQRSSIIVLDEVDKVIRRSSADKWVEQLQFATLPLLNGDPILFEPDDGCPATTISTRGSMVFLMGVFPGTRASNWSDLSASQKTLKRYGFCDEWVSRLTHVIHLKPPTRKEILAILEREAQNLAPLYQSGTDAPSLTVRELNKIADKTVRSPFGVRGARGHIHQLLHSKAVVSAVDNMVF